MISLYFLKKKGFLTLEGNLYDGPVTYKINNLHQVFVRLYFVLVHFAVMVEIKDFSFVLDVMYCYTFNIMTQLQNCVSPRHNDSIMKQLNAMRSWIFPSVTPFKLQIKGLPKLDELFNLITNNTEMHDAIIKKFKNRLYSDIFNILNFYIEDGFNQEFSFKELFLKHRSIDETPVFI